MYEVTLTVTDAAGAPASKVYDYVVVYDRNGPSVTGAGWINSPPRAYAPTSTLTGNAVFSFDVKYKKGASVPTGATQFSLAKFAFKATKFDWLVVTGAKAEFEGTGTVNGKGTYCFLVSVIDNPTIPGKSKPDLFRIKIWEKATGKVVYDTQRGAADTADPTTALGGGAIIIHK